MLTLLLQCHFSYLKMKKQMRIKRPLLLCVVNSLEETARNGAHINADFSDIC